MRIPYSDLTQIPIILDGEGKLPSKGYSGDAGWDLYTSRDVAIPPDKTTDTHTDIYIKIPNGMYGRLTGRSSTLRKYGLLVNEAIIDSNYTGELFVCVRNMGTKTFYIKKGMRLAQIIFGLVLPIQFEITEEALREEGRGSNGFGSTGT